jgi:NAD+ synthase (glutamine-hydrolysing)
MALETVPLRIALAQVNATVGDVDGNAALVREWIGRAREAGAQIVVFPELVLSGYPAEDLLLKPHFLEACANALPVIAEASAGIVSLVGFPQRDGGVRNAAAILADGQVHGTYYKCLLPNYGVFDERRYFEPGPGPALIEIGRARIGLTICEDIWFPGPPASVEALAGASLIVNPSASPYHRGRGVFREGMVADRARETGAAYALCNTVGGQDELVFDGHSVVISDRGETVARARQFAEDLLVCDLELHVSASGTRTADDVGLELLPAGGAPPVLARFDLPHPGGRVEAPLAAVLDDCAEVYAALELGLRDYVQKNGFERVLVAVSGGIDSALVALIAADALGPDRVTCVVMPSPHSSAETQADARAIAANLGAELIEIPIESAMDAYAAILPGDAAVPPPAHATETGTAGIATAEDLTTENLQARIRGNLMMALSNRSGWLVLTTGNKSEMSVGYATLYGDMAGGFAVIKDVPKTLVYELVRYRNQREGRELVPASVLERAPSAELRPDQRDEDSLPPYEVLDPILAAYVEGDRGREEIIADGAAPEVVDQVLAMVDRSEYKRRQAPPGIKITPKAFGRDRRLPITNRFRG